MILMKFMTIGYRPLLKTLQIKEQSLKNDKFLLSYKYSFFIFADIA